MPRDLLADKTTLESMPPLSKEPVASSPPSDEPVSFYRLPANMMEERFKRMKDLHAYALLLNQDDLDDCDWLEHAAFDPHEAASRDKVRCSALRHLCVSPSALCATFVPSGEFAAIIQPSHGEPVLPAR